ncbi:hypothetical protein GCM10027605_53370 [Micromonospora zhanjiangensis]
MPSTVVGSSGHNRPHGGRSARLPNTLDAYPGNTATELLTFAGTGGNPIAINAGNEISEPPPATAFTVPAASPAATSNNP